MRSVTNEEIIDRINGSLQPAVETLGGRMVGVDLEAGSVTFEYDIGAPFCHTGGKTVQGGYVATMLDATMAMAVIVTSDFKRGAPTLELKVSYFLPAKQGRFRSEARIIRMGRTITFAEADLMDADGILVAKATSTLKATERRA